MANKKYGDPKRPKKGKDTTLGYTKATPGKVGYAERKVVGSNIQQKKKKIRSDYMALENPTPKQREAYKSQIQSLNKSYQKTKKRGDKITEKAAQIPMKMERMKKRAKDIIDSCKGTGQGTIFCQQS